MPSLVTPATVTRLDIDPDLQKVGATGVSDGVTAFDVRLIVRVVAHVRGAEVGDACDRHAGSVVVVLDNSVRRVAN